MIYFWNTNAWIEYLLGVFLIEKNHNILNGVLSL
jgi:hypothetical protein